MAHWRVEQLFQMDLGTFQAAMKKSSIRLLLLVVLLTSAQVSQETPFRHSPAEMHQRNKKWCAHVVHKNVSCAVLAGSESFAQPELLPCPPEMINCAPQVIYRTHFRPTYKLDYKTVTELQWRCCPGYQGHDCMEMKSAPRIPERTPENLAPLASGHISAEATDLQGNHPWRGPGGAPRLEDEVQRLSQMVLDMQARITDMSSNLRLDFQEDASKMLAVLLDQTGRPGQPASATGAQTRTVDLFSVDDLVNKIGLLESGSDTWNRLEERVNRHDGQIQHLIEKPPAPVADLRAYVDENLRALRKELMEGMEIKMADLKNSCDYKIMSMYHECEHQEEHYLSLTERMDSKESHLRQQIQELKNELEDSQTRPIPDWLLDKIEGLLNSSVAEQNSKREQGEALKDLKEKLVSMEDSLSKTNRQTPDVPQNEANTLSGSFHTLEDTVNVLDFGLCKANLTILEKSQKTAWEKLLVMEGRLQNLESLPGQLTAVKDHVGVLEDRNCTRVLAGARVVCDGRQPEAKGFRRVQTDVARGLHIQTGVTGDVGAPLARAEDTPPQMPLATETGVAGPPGRMTSSSKLPKGTHGSMAPVLGFAGAPAAPVKPAEPLPYTLPPIADAVAQHKGLQISFAAALALPLVRGEMSVIRFDEVMVNDGGHYDPRTGIFTAPVDGRYLLSATLAAQPGTKMEAVLRVDQRVIHRLDSAPEEPCAAPCAPASLTLVVAMRQGQRAALALTAGKLATDSAYILSSFSGALLYPSSW